MKFVILGLLFLRERTIYEIKKVLEETISLFYSASFGSINSAVKRLLDQEWIKVQETVENGRFKKIYSITPAGIAAYQDWLGSKIENIGSNTLHIDGVDKLHGGEFSIGPDYLEVVSFIGAAAVTKGEIRIRKAAPSYLDMVRLVFSRLGVIWETEEDDILVPAEQSLQIVPDLGGAIPQINVMPWPAFPTDLMSIAIVTATQSTGTVLFHDWMYPSRMFFTDKLVSMGARITLCDPHRCIVVGPNPLLAESLDSPDIRAGMALVLAALAAEGTSEIRNIGQIERGYEGIDTKLKQLGADITKT